MGVETDRFEDILDNFRIVEKGWTQIEFKTISLKDFVSATNLLRPLEDSNLDARLSK